MSLVFIGILAKQYIYKCRCAKKTVSIHRFLVELELIYNIEFSIAKSERKISKHVKRWSPVFLFS